MSSGQDHLGDEAAPFNVHLHITAVVRLGEETIQFPECSSGNSVERAAAVDQAIEEWLLTARVLFSALRRRLFEGVEQVPNDDRGFVGWHALSSVIRLWGPSRAREEFFREFAARFGEVLLLQRIRHALPDFPVDQLVGIRMVMVHIPGRPRNAEVVINGTLHEDASAALCALEWPHSEEAIMFRQFVLLLHRRG